MTAASPTSGHIPASESDFAALLGDVRRLLRTGLPVRPGSAVGDLLDLAGVVARSVRPDDRLSRVDALDRLIRSELRKLGIVELRRPASLLFGVQRGGTSLTDRRRQACHASDYEFDHFRKRIEPKIIEQLAWQVYRDSLQYVQRVADGGPFTASGDSPAIDAEHLQHVDDAQREILLSRIWSDVYGLRAELIVRESTREHVGQQAEHSEAAAGALWHLARLLTNLDRFITLYGQEILHGSAAYNAEGLIRLAGWSGEVTAEQARELRFALARVGEWDRRGFVSALRPTEAMRA